MRYDSTLPNAFSNINPIVHGYSLLRTQLNNDYFHDLFDESAKLGIEIEGHRAFFYLECTSTFKGILSC